jgi:hypothetical protein
MLVLLLVLGAGLGWLDHKVQQARTQRETAKAIAEAQRVTKKFRELGGSVTIDDKSPSRPVISVSFTSTSVTDAVLEHVTGPTPASAARFPRHGLPLQSGEPETVAAARSGNECVPLDSARGAVTLVNRIRHNRGGSAIGRGRKSPEM